MGGSDDDVLMEAGENAAVFVMVLEIPFRASIVVAVAERRGLGDSTMSTVFFMELSSKATALFLFSETGDDDGAVVARRVVGEVVMVVEGDFVVVDLRSKVEAAS